MDNAAGDARAHDPLNDSIQHGLPLALTVAVRPWGFSNAELSSWLPDLSSLNGLLRWTVAHDRAAAGADVVVHFVRPSTHDRNALCWNCVGANRAMITALEKQRLELVLFAGDANELPQSRAGFWAIAGQLPPNAALDAIGRMIGASALPWQASRLAVRKDLLQLIARRVDASSSDVTAA